MQHHERTNAKIILIVEDCIADLRTSIRMLKKIDPEIITSQAEDGDLAIEKLKDSEDMDLPDLIFLDLNLPGTDGREVLAYIKGSARLKKIPVIIMTTSTDDKDIQICYEKGANCYMQKPLNLKLLSFSYQSIVRFWFQTVLLPRMCELN